MTNELQKNTGKNKNLKKKNNAGYNLNNDLMHFFHNKDKSTVDQKSKQIAELKQKTKQLNDRCCEKISKQNFIQAEQDLKYARKLLNLAIKQSKKTTKYLLVCLQLNFACVSQGLWDFEKSLKHMQIAIQEIKKILKTNKFGVLKKIEEVYIPQKISQLQIYKIQLRRQKIMISYLLQLSGIYSLTQNHEGAYSIICETLKLYQNICKSLTQDKQSSLQNSYYYSTFNENIMLILSQLSDSISFTLNKKIDLMKIQQYYHQTHLYLCEFNKKVQNKAYQENQLKKAFSILHISSVMRLKPIQIDEFIKNMNQPEKINHKNVYMLVFYVSVCYYALSTQRRLIYLKEVSVKNHKSISKDLIICQIHHLKAINLLVKYIPYPSPFLSHLISNFQNKYDVNLMEYQSLPSVQDLQIYGSHKIKKFSPASSKQKQINSLRECCQFQTVNIYERGIVQKIVNTKQNIMKFGLQKNLNKRLKQQFGSSNKSSESIQKLKIRNKKSWNSLISRQCIKRINKAEDSLNEKEGRSKSEWKIVKRIGFSSENHERYPKKDKKQFDTLSKNSKKSTNKYKSTNHSRSKSKQTYSQNQYFKNCKSKTSKISSGKFIQMIRNY